MITSPGGKKTKFKIDSLGRIREETVAFDTSDAATTTRTYDGVGNVTSITDPMGRVTSFTYDNRNRKIRQDAPLSRTTRWEYDAVGNVTKEINPDNTFTRKEYDAMNRVIRAYDERNQLTSYSYTASGKVHQITDPRNSVYSHAYDASDRLTSRVYPGGSSEQWTYDAAGNVATETTRTGQILRRYYDNRNRETQRDWDGYAAPSVWTSYDAASRVATRMNWHARLAYTYDAAGQVLSEEQKIHGPTSTEDGKTATITYTYDADGNRTSFGSPAITLNYTYTNRQQLSAIRYMGMDWATFTYNAAGQRRFRHNINGTASDVNYDGAGRLNYLMNYRSTDGSWIFLQKFGYDVRDRRTWVLRDDQYGDTWRYQEDSQLIEQRTHVWRPDQNFWNSAAFTDGFSYDASGNRTAWNQNGSVTSYTADALNQYTSVTGLTIQHDGRSNISRLGAWTFTYDAENRLSRAVGPGHDIWPHYDPHGRLVKVVNNGTYEYRFYDGAQQFWRLLQNGAWLDLTIWGPTPDEVVSRHVPNPDWWLSWQFYHQDPLNSVVAITNINRTVLERYLYDAFGAADIRDGSWNPRATSAVGNRWQFTGQEWWPEMGLHNYKARLYSSELGRFMQHDPIRFDAGDMNLYRYCWNNPANLVDPDGCIPADLAAKLLDIANKSYVLAASANPTSSATRVGTLTHSVIAKQASAKFPGALVEQNARGGNLYTRPVSGGIRSDLVIPQGTNARGGTHSVVADFKTGGPSNTLSPTRAGAIVSNLPSAGGQTYEVVQVRPTVGPHGASGGVSVVAPTRSGPVSAGPRGIPLGGHPPLPITDIRQGSTIAIGGGSGGGPGGMEDAELH